MVQYSRLSRQNERILTCQSSIRWPTRRRASFTTPRSASGTGDSLDSAILRYYYMQDMDVPEAVRELERQSMNYTASWLYQKKEIALVRVAAAVRRLGFL